MKEKIMLTVIITVFLFFNSYAQSDDKKWAVGVNFSSIIFSGEGINKVKDRRNSQFPTFQLSKYIGNQFSIDLSYTSETIKSLNTVNEFNYSSVDAYLRYNLPEIFLKIVPFGGVGLGYIEGASTTPDPKSVISLNFMVGGTLWLSDRFGLSSRFIYKNVSASSLSMASHLQITAGIIYAFNFNSSSGNRQKRLWDVEH